MNSKRWLALFVENDVGVLAEISGLFAGKAYNLDSLTVGVTADKTVSRMTICLTGGDELFEQVKKQLNRNVNVIKLVDLTDSLTAERELAFLKIARSSINAVMPLADDYGLRVLQRDGESVLLQSVNPQSVNDALTEALTKKDIPFEIVRGGSVAI